MEENPRIGISGIQLLNEDQEVTKSCSRFCSLSRVIFHSLGIAYFFPRFGMPMNEWDHKDSREVQQVIGAYFFIRNELFKSLNGFDERFFLFYEEMDLSYRAHLKGWKSFFISNLQGLHVGGGTTDSIKSTRLFYSLKSSLQYSYKNFNKDSSFLAFIFTVFVEFLVRSIIFSLIKLSLSNLLDTLFAYLDLYRWFWTKLTFSKYKK